MAEGMECDVVVLGATGFTGKLVVECLARGSEGVRWVITARSVAKLEELVSSCKYKGIDISRVPTCMVDVNDKESLLRALRPAKLVLNCVGPNTRYSEPVVDACISARTHYVDMSAEINHILNLYVKYQEAAEAANVLVVPSCAFASLVAASGYIYLKNLFHGTLNSVECYAEIGIPKRSYVPCTGSLASYGTWDSLVHVLKNLKEYQRLKAKTFPTIELPKEIKRNFFHWRRRHLWYPYPGPDEDVMEFSERYLKDKRQKRFTHFKLYTRMPLFFHYLVIPAMFLYFYLSYFNWFANLLRRFPRLFTIGYMSHDGPSEKMREKTKYNFSYIGTGWDKTVEDLSKPPNKTVKVKVSSKDPYGSSAVLMIIAAITILREQSVMPSGGVVNIGAAFYNTTIVERLRNTGIKYEVIPNT